MPATSVPATTNKVTGSLTATCAGGVMVKQPTYEPNNPDIHIRGTMTSWTHPQHT